MITVRTSRLLRFPDSLKRARLLMDDVSGECLKCLDQRAIVECEICLQCVALVDDWYRAVGCFGIDFVQSDPQSGRSKFVGIKFGCHGVSPV